MRRQLLLLLLFQITVNAEAENKTVSFNRDVKPILSDRCFKCHGPDAKNQNSEYRVDTEEHAHADLGGYFGIVPGDLEESELYFRIHSDDPDEVMPPPESKMGLTDAEKDILKRWILQGAKYEKHWSFISIPEEIEVPENGKGWAKNEIDHFIARKFEEVGLEPAVESPKEKWLRRASFDLTGLPPTLAEIDAFLADNSEKAYEGQVDRLLETNAHAERMTAEWLDVARYSDSYGYQRDEERQVWPWRDWVLRAFRDNKPYSEFITEQIAGDMLPNATDDQRLATAFNRLHGHVMEGGSVPEEYRIEYVADRVETAGTAFLGLTMNCTKCHDHKYDPLTAKDFYAMSSFFANIDEHGLISYFTGMAPTPKMSLPTDEQRAELREAEKKIALAEKELNDLFATAEADFQLWLATREAGKESRSPEQEVHLAFEEMNSGSRKSANKDLEVVVIENLANSVHRAETRSANILVEGHLGKAIKVTGDDVLEVREVGAYDREQPWSFSVWIKPDDIHPKANIVTRGRGTDDSGAMGYEFLLLDGVPTASVVHFWPGNSIRVQAKEKVKVDEWIHLGLTYDGSSKASGLKIYLNGEVADVNVVHDSLTRTISQFRKLPKGQEELGLVLGHRYRESGFKNGAIDEFEFWTREISPLEMFHAYDHQSLERLLRKDVSEMLPKEKEALKAYYFSAVNSTIREAKIEVQKSRLTWNKIKDRIPEIPVMREQSTVRKAYILNRGAYDSRAEEVTANTPSFLLPMTDEMTRDRLGFAKWMIASNNPLTSRVAVNRYWQVVFGIGLVNTPEDFGNQGAPPSHPDLLDWLSREFMKSGWDVKALLKKMVLSATYRQSTVVGSYARNKDPENIYLGRSHHTRLSAEMIRDNALAVSGLLVERWGGPPVKPYQVSEAFVPAKPDSGEGLYRRSVYTWWKRNSAAPVMTTFGAPKRDICTVKREVTSSPIQSLILLNDPQFVEAARMLAEKLCLKYGDDHEAMIIEAYRALTSRLPRGNEMALLNQLYDQQLQEYQNTPGDAEKLLSVGEASRDTSLSPILHAAATIVVNAMMNLDESLTER